ncbi:MAG: hypothetical protein OXL97_10145 [Chloroflexota bacterium]|nr:hypothetical protein [Chloroflexota bacterium]MDE2885212.1 hypothetical protein [Chloroflexota bacterium]
MAIVATVGFAAKQKAAQLALQFAIAAASKVLAPTAKAAVKAGAERMRKAADWFEEAARRYEVAATEAEGKRRLYLSAEAAGARGMAVGLREVATLIEQNADDATIESAAAEAATNLKVLVARRRTPSATE